MSNVLLWWLNRVSKKLDTNKWPVGGARLQTIGNICYGANLRVFYLTSTQSSPGFLYVHPFPEPHPGPLPDINKDGIRQPCRRRRICPFNHHSQGKCHRSLLYPCRCLCRGCFRLATHPLPACRPGADTIIVGVKFVLFLYCSAVRKNSSQVHVLWEDHRNDLFVNGFGKTG
jgi:hypothetical protein